MKKICMITGANAGIGRAAALQIAQEGHHVILACRSEKRGEKAVEYIKERCVDASVELMILDISSKESINKFMEDFKSKYEKLDILINNAAFFDITMREPKFNENGIEYVWATNHIGVVHLTEGLINLLKKSKQGRIINIASKGLIVHPNIKVDLEDPEFKKRKFKVSKAYYQSKIAQVMYTYWLGDKLKETSVTVNCIRVTNVKVDLERYPNLSSIARFAYKMKSKKSITPEKMAETYKYLALSDEVSKRTGLYFDENNRTVNSSSYSTSRENMRDVMKLTEEYIKRF